MSKVTRSSRKLNEQEASSRRSSGGWKVTQTSMKGLKESVSASTSSCLRRSARVTPSKSSSVCSPSSLRKSKKAVIFKSHVTSVVGTKRKSREENEDSPLPPSKRAFKPSENKTAHKSPETRSGYRHDKNAKKPNTSGHPDTKKFEKNKAIKKSEKKQQSKSPYSLDKKKSGNKRSKFSASLNMKKPEERKASKSPGSSYMKKPEGGKVSKLSSSLKIRTSEEGKTGKSPRKSEESNTSRGSSNGYSGKDEKQEREVVLETSRPSKKREEKAGGETAKEPPGRKVGTTSKRLDARRYRQLFASKPKEHKKGGDPGQSSYVIRDGFSEAVGSDKVRSVNVVKASMDLGANCVKEHVENRDFCRLRSGKSIVKSIPATENSLDRDSESAELEAGILNAEADPQTSVSEESYVLSKHHEGYVNVSCSQQVLDFSQSPFASRDQDSERDSVFSDHKLPQIDCQMALSCENGKIPSMGLMRSPERNSLDDAILSISTGTEAKNSGEGSQIVAADSCSSQIDKNLSGSDTSKRGVDAMLTPQRDSSQADMQLYDGNNLQESTLRHSCKNCDVLTVSVRVFSDTSGLKNGFSETAHSGEKSHVASAGLCTTRVNKESADSCTSKEGERVVDCHHDTSVDTKKEFSTLDVSEDGKTPVFLSGNKRDRCEGTLESSGTGNGDSVCGIESSKKSRLDETPVAPEDTERLQMIPEGDSEASTNYSLLQSSNLEHPKDTECNTCEVCKLGGKLLCCDGKGCNRAYHLSCLEPPLVDALPGTWHCLWCVKRKLEFGLHSVSGGVESIWAVRGSSSTQNKVEKEYLVKYKGLAHVHNRWISETQLLADAPKILAKFNIRYQKNKAPKWKSEWTEPERLLKRRLLMPPKVADEYFRNNTKSVYCNDEWLVKWKGLGYEFSTWEMENASFLTSSEAMILVKDFETRREKAKQASYPSKANMVHSEIDMQIKIQRLSHEQLPVQGLGFVSKLYKYWHRRHNAIIIDDQERIARAALFISMLVSSVSRPFLILSPSSAFSAWELEIMHVVPHIDLVVYNGSKNVRDMIRGLEFYEESGCIMFQVLLSTPDAVAEDMEFLECIGWESIIIDQCHSSKMSRHFEKIRGLNTDFRLLLFNGQIKCCDHPYLVDESLQSSLTEGFPLSELLDIGVRASGKLLLLDKILSEIKNKGLRVLILFQADFVQIVLYVNFNVFSYVELQWQFIGGSAPHSIGDILDDYLRQRFGADSYERIDSGLAVSKKQLALNMFNDKEKGRFVFLLENRACAPSIRLSAVDAIIIFGSDWNPSNDLKALQKINIEFQIERLAVFRLYIPYTLEERILCFYTEDTVLDNKLDNLGPSIHHMLLMWGSFHLFKKFDELQDAQVQHSGSIFPDNEKLLEKTFQEVVSLLAPVTNINCQPKSSSVSKMKQDFSFFSKSTLFSGESRPCFSEGDQPHIYWNKLLEGRVDVRSLTGLVQRPRRKVHHFVQSTTKLTEGEDDIKKQKKAAGSSNVASSSAGLQAVDVSGMNEGAIIVMQEEDISGMNEGEKIVLQAEDISGMNEGAKIVLQAEDISDMNEGADIVTTDLHKSVSDGPASTSCKNPCSMKETGGVFTTHLERESPPAIPNKDHVMETSSVNVVELEDGRDACATQQSLHALLRLELLKLCKALQLPKEVVDVAIASLEYVMKNHQVAKESESILQAFLMSLCWAAASMLDYAVDHEASLVLAKQQLQFKCEKVEVRSVYKKLRSFGPYLKSEISGKVVGENCKDNRANIHANSIPHERLQELAGKTISDLEGKQCIENEDPLLQGECPKSEQVGQSVNRTNAFHEDRAEQEKTTSETTSLINKLYSFKKKRMKYIIDKQKEEFAEFLKFKEMVMSKMTQEYAASRSDILKECDLSIREKKLIVLLQYFSDRRTSHKRRMELYSENLTHRQRELRDREVQTYSHWVEEAKAGRSAEPYLLLPLPSIQFRKEDLETESQNSANKRAANMSQSCNNANEGVTSEPLSNGLDNAPAISPGLAVGTTGSSGISVTSPDTCSMLTADSQANLKGQNTLVGSETVKNPSILGSADVLASTKEDNRADAVMWPMKSNVLTKANHVTAMDSELNNVHATMETGIPPGLEDQIGTAAGSLQQKSGSTSQMADGLRTEVGPEQVSSVEPGERSAPAGTRNDHVIEVAGQDILPEVRVSVPQPLDASSSAAQVHVCTVDHERPTSAEMEGDTELVPPSQARVFPRSLDAFPSSARQVVQASSASSDGRSAETVREFDHGIAGLESFHETALAGTRNGHENEVAGQDILPQARVSVQLPVDASSSAVQVLVSTMDHERPTSAEMEGDTGLGSHSQARVSPQSPNALPSTVRQIVQASSASSDGRSASAETEREFDNGATESFHETSASVPQPLDACASSAEHVIEASSCVDARRSTCAGTAREHDHGLGRLEYPCHEGVPVQQPLGTFPFSAERFRVSSANPDERSAPAESARAETVKEHYHGLGRLESPCHAGVPVQQPLGTFTLPVEVQVSSANLGERPACAESARDSEHAVAMPESLPQVRVSLQQPHDASRSSAERVAHCPCVFLPATPLLPSSGSHSITSANIRGRTIGSEPVEQTLRTAAPISHVPLVNYPDLLFNEIVGMRVEEEQTKKLYEDAKVRLTLERDKEIEEVKRKYEKLLQDAESRYSLTKKTLEDNMMKVSLNRSLGVAFMFLDPKASQLVVQPGKFSTQAPIQQSGNGSAAHRTDPISGIGPSFIVPAPTVGDLQVACRGLNLRPVPSVPSPPSATNPAALVYLSDDD